MFAGTLISRWPACPWIRERVCRRPYNGSIERWHLRQQLRNSHHDNTEREGSITDLGWWIPD